MCDCSDLIGLRYRLGADGSNGEIDCIHLVYTVLKRVGIVTPPLRQDWYTANWRTIARALLNWGDQVDRPEYDGDVLLLMQDTKAFAVTWQTGILYINSQLETVAWCPISSITNYRCFRSSGN